MRRSDSINYLSPEEIRERRKYFLKEANKVTTIHKGDKRVSGARFCVICGTPLSNMILTDGSTQAARDHFHCYFSDLFYVNMCKNSNNCKRVMKKYEESE